MTPVKRFLLIFFGVYVGVGLLANFAAGPPGLSKAYLAQYKVEHERYLEIVKGDEYKLHVQRPVLHPVDPAVKTFVEAYEGREEFKQEKRRQAGYQFFNELFTCIMLTVLAVRFGWKPLVKFLDDQVALVRAKIAEAERGRADAAGRKQAAQDTLDRLPEEQARTVRETDAVIAQEQAEFEAMTQATLERIDREVEERKREEEEAAAYRVKQELLNQVTDLLAQRYLAGASAEVESGQIDAFILDVEARS